MNYKAIILAADDGKAINSDRPAAMHEVLGEPLVGWIIDSIEGAGIGASDITAVTAGNSEELDKYLSGRGITNNIALSGNRDICKAVLGAAGNFPGDENILIMNACTPFVNSDTVAAALNEHSYSGSDVTFTEAGMYWFRAKALVSALSQLSGDSLDDAVPLIVKAGGKAGEFQLSEPDIAIAVKTRADLLRLNITARMAVIGKLLDDGVEFISTDGVIIEKNVRIGRDTTILPGTIIRGNTVIGEHCVIGPNTIIENCTLGNGVTLNSVQAFDSKIADRVKAGPFVQLRPGTVLHEGVKIGDFVEIKNSEIGMNTAVSHLTYLGDSDVGKGVNFGCGCVTANYDGVNKFRTKIGDHAFIGCNTNLVAPVEIGENATTAAGSTITKHDTVPANSLALQRAETKVIENWEHNFKRVKKA